MSADLDRFSAVYAHKALPEVEADRARLAMVQQAMADFEQLRASLELMHAQRNGDVRAPLVTLVDMGQGCFMQARTSGFVCIDVGLGFHVEMTEQEGVAFVDKKVRGRASVFSWPPNDAPAQLVLLEQLQHIAAQRLELSSARARDMQQALAQLQRAVADAQEG